MVNVPQFTMGANILPSFMQGAEGVSNALAQWQQRKMQNRQIDQQDKRFAQQDKQWNASNALAQAQFGLQKRSADRADELAPGQLQLQLGQLDVQRAQLAQMKAHGATEQQMAPYKLQLMQAQTDLAAANARAAGTKDEIGSAVAGVLKGMSPQQQQPSYAPGGQAAPMPQPPPSFDGGSSAVPQQLHPGYAPGVRPQGFNGAPPTMPGIQPVADVGGDPNLVLTQGMAPQPQPQQPTPAERIHTPFGPMTKSELQQRAIGLSAHPQTAPMAKMLMDVGNANALGKEARNEVDKKEINTTMALGRLSEIANGYDPKHLTAMEQAKQVGLSWKGWLTGKLPPEQAAQRQEHVKFRQNVVDNLNRHIQDMTGAAMGVDEAKRLMAAMPNMDDDPDAFKAKLDGVRRQSALSIARYRLLRTDGFQGKPWTGTADDASKAIPLHKMQGVIQDSAKAVYQRIKQQSPGMPHDQIMGTVKEVIAQKFGIDA